MKTNENKTKDYVLRAVKNYQDKFDRIVVLAPMGTKERIKATGAASVTTFINAAIAAALEKAENETAAGAGSE